MARQPITRSFARSLRDRGRVGMFNIVLVAIVANSAIVAALKLYQSTNDITMINQLVHCMISDLPAKSIQETPIEIMKGIR